MASKNTPIKEKVPPIVLLKYKPGETIIKGGDFGITIYMIVEGEVEIYIESDDKELSIVTIGPGEVIGEMVFLTGTASRRTASARAVKYTILEAWHPSRLSSEYANSPIILRFMVNQILKRLKNMNRMVMELEKAKARKKELENYDPWASHRKFYRKQVDIEVMYRTIDAATKAILWGMMKDLSRTGMCLEVPQTNNYKCSHEPGDLFAASSFLPNGKRLDVKMKIVRIHESIDKRVITLGLLFVDLNEHINKKLGFFLMR